MPELLLELFSEEIPARMQARGAEDLARLATAALAPLEPTEVRTFCGPRRIALAARVKAGVAATSSVERGPRVSAPEQALAGFLRKHGAAREQLRQEGEFWVLDKTSAGIDAAALIAREVPPLLRRFPWPKSMRWGGTSAFTWVRPLRRILCILDGETVPFDLREGEDDGHGLASGNLTEGHRFMAPEVFAVRSVQEWDEALRAHHVMADAAERRAMIEAGLRDAAAARGLAIVEDAGLLDEVAGLVEWPVPLIGAIDPAFMDLPPEVMQVSMRVNQRYFALRDGTGAVAPYFAFVANIAARDGGAAIIAGNERVLRARFADARHFWDADRAQTLASRVPALEGITFHAKLGTQGARVRRMVHLAAVIALQVGADKALAERAALLAKADLVTGMVGEFPELQGVMGRYYARHDGENDAVADAVRDHYAPKGAADAVPEAPVSVAVALADKIDMLAAFFAVGEKPTGSGDPFALRRAALGIIRIIRENGLRLPLRPLMTWAFQALGLSAIAAENQPLLGGRGIEPDPMTDTGSVNSDGIASSSEFKRASVDELLNFIMDRLRIQLRAEGARHDVLSAVLGLQSDDDLVRVLARTDAVAAMLGTEDGANLLAGYRRAANILRIEEKKDGPHDGPVEAALLAAPEESHLFDALARVETDVAHLIDEEENFPAAMESLATLRRPLDNFFDKVTVNDSRPEIRRNRLRLLARVRAAMHLAADFSRLEG